ncbi:hypothetical protein [uncultured Acinetobacter sp.]|uniref:hypothetical protein n=1 Tax=uncultured Acinetobacter sp. TaxID=165433 RepID=UPI00258ACA42|nr:hypothetical protein [uncultured Acinetobacter sp.]
MNLDAHSIIDYVGKVPWRSNECIRVFWVKISEGSRTIISEHLDTLSSQELIVPIILRDVLFVNANAVLSDFNKLLEGNKSCFDKIEKNKYQQITIILLLKEDFKLSQISSPIVLPRWFPVLSGAETFFRISDLLLSAEVDLLHCPEAGIERLAIALYDLESNVIKRLREVESKDSRLIRSLIDTLYSESKTGSTETILNNFEKTTEAVTDPTAYRPTASKTTSLLSLLLKQVLKSSPDQLASMAKKLSEAMIDQSTESLKPTIFAIMLRPSNKVENLTRNWHSILIAAYQAYQLMNASAHAGEYPSYPVSLIHSNSRDLVRFLSEANKYICCLFEE